MRNVIHRLLVITVSLSVAIEAVTWLLSKIQVYPHLLTSGPLSPLGWFANPVPNMVKLLLMIVSPGISTYLGYTISVLMMILVIRRLNLIIRANSFSASTPRLPAPVYVMATIGFGALVIASALLFLLELSVLQTSALPFNWYSTAVMELAIFLLPLSFLLNELWSFRKN